MKSLVFGTAGIPLSTKPRHTEEGVRRVRALGLDAMELEFVHSVNLSPEKAALVKKAAQKERVILTCHASYYINLNAREPEKKKASIGRIVNSARVLAAAGGWSACFHAGYYMKMPPKDVAVTIQEALEAVVDTCKEESLDVWIRPEIGGKTTSFGSLEEVLELSQSLDKVQPCIDWAHLYARSLEKINSLGAYRDVLEKIEAALGKEALNNMHCHMEGIALGKTGEKNHLPLKDSRFNYKAVLQAMKEFDCKGVVICESPTIEEDALILQKAYLKK